MHEHPNRLALIVVSVLLVAGSVVAAAALMGGQTSRILSTVGAAVGPPDGGGDTSGSGSGSDDTPGPAPAGAGSASSGSGADGQVADAAALVPTLLIVRTGTASLEVADLDAALRAGDTAVLDAGGYVSGSTRSSSGDDRSAKVTYRIPSARWDATLARLHGLAVKLDGEHVETAEVSGQVVDLAARIANLRATETALQAIMAKATAIKDVLDVQRQLTTTRGEIEQLVAKKQALEGQASFGTLDVTYHLPAVVKPAARPAPAPAWDPAGDVSRATARLVRIGQVATSVGIWLAIVGLPLLLGAAVLTFAAWQLYRLGRWLVRRRPGAWSEGG